jgi:hypothetical protein
MAERERTGKGEIDDGIQRRKKARESAEDKVKAPSETTESNTVNAASVEAHTSLLSDARLSHPANVGMKAELLSDLQRSYGNAYVQRLLKSRAVQAKLTVNPPDDIHEKEADRMAEMVTGASGSLVQRQEEEEIEAKLASNQPQQGLQRQEEEEEPVQPKAASGQVPAVSEDMEARINTARGGGQELPESIRGSLEPHFGRDFSEVRVHTDGEADDLSQKLGARAFTTGQDVFFRSGDYQPESEDGRKLLGHEMTHVVQQGGAPISRKAVETEEKGAPADKKEAEAELKKLATRACSDMSLANMKALLLQVAHCQEIGADEAARDALDQVAGQAVAVLKRKTNAFNVETSSRIMAKDLLDQLATVQLLGGKDAGRAGEKALEKLLQWAQGQLAGAIKELQRAPSELTAKHVLEKGALVQMLGGDATAAMAALQTWKETEKA